MVELTWALLATPTHLNPAGILHHSTVWYFTLCITVRITLHVEITQLLIVSNYRVLRFSFQFIVINIHNTAENDLISIYEEEVQDRQHLSLLQKHLFLDVIHLIVTFNSNTLIQLDKVTTREEELVLMFCNCLLIDKYFGNKKVE